VGIAQGDVKRVRREVGEVVGGKLFEGAHESLFVVGRLDGEAVCFALMAARNHVQQKTQQQLDGLKQQGEENQAGVDRSLLHKERLKQERGAQAEGKGAEQRSAEDHTYGQIFQDVLFPIVPDFVGQDGDELRNGVRPDQGVEKRDATVLSEAGEKGVALGAAPGAVHDGNVLQGKRIDSA